MISLRSIAAAAAVAAVAATPLAASAVSTKGPVAVTSCAADTVAPTTAFAPVPIQFGNVYLSFTNTSSVPAKNVELLVGYNGTVQTFDTAGTFSPGIRIERSASTIPFVNATDVTCQVAKVDFSDGTSWTAPDLAPQTTAQL
jgi:hypothetical protein